MNRGGTTRHLPPASLKKPRSATTFALRWMEEQQRRDIGRRLWELRENSSHTNRSIGDAVGVSERTVAEWVAGRQGITYDHARAVAKLFEVELDWFWNGTPQMPAPDPFSSATEERLARAEDRATQALAIVAALDEKLDAALDLLHRLQPQGQSEEPGG